MIIQRDCALFTIIYHNFINYFIDSDKKQIQSDNGLWIWLKYGMVFLIKICDCWDENQIVKW